MKRLHVKVLIVLLCLNKLIAAPSLDEKIAQMIMVGFNGSTLEEKWVQQIGWDIEKDRIGGVLLLGRNITSSSQLKSLTSFLQEKAKKLPLLIAVDQEGGRVARLSPMKGFDAFPSAYEVAENMSIVEAKETYTKMAKLLDEHHINYNLAPVVDIAQENSPIIGKKERSYSSYANIVSIYGGTFIEASHEQGILTSLKHFPGHGSALEDSHIAQTDVSLSWEFDELRPYYDLIKQKKVDSIMVGHLYLKRFDLTYPATLSSTIINGLLRDRIGYDGVVISDDMMMKGVSERFSLEERIVLSINAGVDILLFSDYFMKGSNAPRIIKQIIIQAIQDGKIKESTITRSYERIKAMKKGLR